MQDLTAHIINSKQVRRRSVNPFDLDRILSQIVSSQDTIRESIRTRSKNKCLHNLPKVTEIDNAILSKKNFEINTQ